MHLSANPSFHAGPVLKIDEIRAAAPCCSAAAEIHAGPTEKVPTVPSACSPMVLWTVPLHC